MKTAINTCTWGGYTKFLGRKLKAADFLRDAAEAGYDGVEIGGGEEFLGTPKECRKRVESLGLEIAAYSASVTYNPYRPNTVRYEKAMRYAAELGVELLMVCGGFNPTPRRTMYPFDYDMFAGNLGRAMKYAKKLGLTIAFHPHRGCVVETIRETGEMVKRLPDMKICVDIAHLEASGEDAAKFIRTFKKKIVYTHVKDYHWKNDTFIELGKGDGKLDVADCVGELRKTKYDGWLTVELDKKWSGKNPRTPLRSARMCRQYLRERCRV